MRGVVGLAAAALAAVVFSACGSSRGVSAPISPLPHVTVDWPGTVLFEADAPSRGLGMDNTDLFAATPNGRVLDLNETSATTESNATWSADGSRVVFERDSATGDASGAVALHAGIFTWSPGQGAPRRVASCPSDGCAQYDFAWSPDDRHIAFVAGSGAVSVMSADGSGVHTVCDGKRCGYGLTLPRWSPDGRKLVFSNEGHDDFKGATGAPMPDTASNVWVANADGSGVEKLTQPTCDAAEVVSRHCAIDADPTWSPNGKLIAFSRTGRAGPTRLEVMHADGSHLRSLSNCGACGEVLRLAWSLDGKAIASVSWFGYKHSFRITTLSGKTSTVRTCTTSRCVYPDDLTWSPSGEQLALLAGDDPITSNVWLIGRDGKALHRIAVGADSCCLAWVRHVYMNRAKAIPKVVAGGRPHLSGTIYYDDSDGKLAFLSLGTSGPSESHITAIEGSEPALSPDGRELAFSAAAASPLSVSNVYVADRNGQHVRVLTHSENGAGSPAWSPDGRTIAYSGSDIWLVSATGGHRRRLTSSGDCGNTVSWNPSGSELVFACSIQSGIALFTIRPDGSGLRRLTSLPGMQELPLWSPDGKEIEFAWTTLSTVGLYLIRPDGTHLRRVTTTPLQGTPTWSPDSRYLALLDQTDTAAGSRLLVVDAETGRVSTVAMVPGGWDENPSWSSH